MPKKMIVATGPGKIRLSENSCLIITGNLEQHER